jgi:cyclopropane fatty-acyl-phospholipid synthase-like methyltransferase
MAATVSSPTSPPDGADTPVSKAAVDIKTMKLYSNIERIENELLQAGVAAGGPIKVDQLFALDSLHYEGTAAVDAGIEEAGLVAGSSVLDVGSGLGGPARYMAHKAGCNVCAAELQQDVHAKAVELTERCGLSGLVQHICADIMECDPASLGGGPGSFDAAVGWLTYLHIADKPAALAKTAAAMKSGSKLFIEDYYVQSALTAAEAESLKTDVYCEQLPTREEYIAAATGAGFTDVRFEDKTADWTQFVSERLQLFEQGRECFVRVHSDASYASLHHFYSAVQQLFLGGNLGGVRLVATRV